MPLSEEQHISGFNSADPTPEPPAEYLKAVRSRRRTAARGRAAWSCGFGAAAAVALMVWISQPGAAPVAPTGQQPLRTGVMASANAASGESLGVLNRAWAASERLPLLDRDPAERSARAPLRFGDARYFESIDG